MRSLCSAILAGVAAAVCACSAITGLNDLSSGACVGACIDAGLGALGQDTDSAYGPASDTTPPLGDDATEDTTTAADGSGGVAQGSSGSSSGGSVGGGSGSSGGSSSSAGSTCMGTRCPPCIPVYQTTCCKSTGACGCMVIIPPSNTCM